MTVNHLIKKFIFLCLIESLLGALICFAIPADQNGYMASIQDKEALLLNSKSPRIIFVGGSNLAFGLDSERVEKEFNRPVINFGLHAGLGLTTSLNLILKYATQGDMVVVVPEYESFEQAQILYGANDMLSDFVEIDPANIQYIAGNKWVDLPLIAFDLPEKKLNRTLESMFPPLGKKSIYIRSNFNHYGDMIGHLGKKPAHSYEITNKAALLPELAFMDASFDILEEFHQRIIEKGGIVVLDFPSLRMQNCNNTGVKEFDSLLAALKAHTTIPVLSTPYARCYPDNYFYDTKYHLTAKGREIRTQQMIKSLSPILIKSGDNLP